MLEIALGIGSLCATLVETGARSVGTQTLYALALMLIVAGGLWAVLAICRQG